MPPRTKGSQRHLLAWLKSGGLSRAVTEAAEPPLHSPLFDWLPRGGSFANEWRGVGYLAEDRPEVAAAYRAWWPTTGNVPNWDAVGRREVDGQTEWLLVEAKAHLHELDQSCAAKDAREGGSREVIARRLDEVKAALSPGNPNDWLAHYYQYANRLATLWFLHEHSVKARLLHICFVGDEDFRDAPSTREEWLWGRRRLPGVDTMHEWFGRPFAYALEVRLHELFLPVLPGA